MTPRVVDVLVPVALDQTYSYRVPAGSIWRRAMWSRCRLGAREQTMGVVWGDNPRPTAPAQPPERRRGQARRAAAQGANCAVRRLGLQLHAGLARHGAAHGPAHGRASRPRPRARRRAARRPAAAAHDRGARARARACSATVWSRCKGEAAQEAGVSAGVIDGLIDEGTLETRGAAARDAGASRPIRISVKPDFSLGQLAAADALRTTVTQAATPPRCSTASPAPARPRSISRRWPRTSGASGRR